MPARPTRKAATQPQPNSKSAKPRASDKSEASHAHDTSSASTCSLPEQEADELVNQLVDNLKALNIRRTRGLVSLLREMALHHHPMTLQEMGGKAALEFLDQATVYRLMMKLEEAAIVRRFSFLGRSTHFQLNIRGHHHDYLICKVCEGITQVHVKLPLEAVRQTVAVNSGWHDVQVELEFYGICPSCATAGKVQAAKLAGRS